MISAMTACRFPPPGTARQAPAPCTQFAFHRQMLVRIAAPARQTEFGRQAAREHWNETTHRRVAVTVERPSVRKPGSVPTGTNSAMAAPLVGESSVEIRLAQRSSKRRSGALHLRVPERPSSAGSPPPPRRLRRVGLPSSSVEAHSFSPSATREAMTFLLHLSDIYHQETAAHQIVVFGR